MPKAVRVLIPIVAVLVSLPVLGYRLLDTAITSDHSRFSVSSSSEVAESNGILVKRLPVVGAPLHWSDIHVTIPDAWIEEATQVRYRLLLWGPRRVRLDCHRLVFTLGGPDGRSLTSSARETLSGMGDFPQYLLDGVDHWAIIDYGGSPVYSVDIGQNDLDTLTLPLDSSSMDTAPCV